MEQSRNLLGKVFTDREPFKFGPERNASRMRGIAFEGQRGGSFEMADFFANIGNVFFQSVQRPLD